MIKIFALTIGGLLGGAGLLALFTVISAECRMTRRPVRRIYEERMDQPDYCPLDRISGRFLDFLLRKEDTAFFHHNGIDWRYMRNALRMDLKKRKIALGGSTITQQLVKNLYFHFGKDLFRKLQEIYMALRVEKILTKDEILELYINVIYYGCGNYGITDAAAYYFSEKPEELSVNQAFMLVILLSAPTARNPLLHPDAYERYAKMILFRWRGWDAFTEEEYKEIIACHANGFDPKLRKSADGEWKYGKNIYVNERFGAGEGGPH